MRRTLCAAAILALAAGRALAQTPPPAPPPAVKEELGRDLFGEAEPGDQAIDPSADQPPETTPAPAGAPPPSGIHPDASTAPYGARVTESFRAAQQFQGPLDGGWTLAGADGAPLFSLRFVEHGDKLEAAWRDLRRTGALEASGVVDEVTRAGDRLTLRFAPRAGVETLAQLSAAPGGVWTGELKAGRRTRSVVLSKTSP